MYTCIRKFLTNKVYAGKKNILYVYNIKTGNSTIVPFIVDKNRKNYE